MKQKYILMILFTLLSLTIIACSNLLQSEDRVTMEGTVLEISESSILILDKNEQLYSVHLNDETKFIQGVSKTFEINNKVTIIYNGTVAESYPMQITAMEITSNQEMISIDQREIVSGIIGDFPSVIVHSYYPQGKVTVDLPFAIELPFESPNQNWSYTLSSKNIQVFSEGADANQSKYYFGIKIVEPGDYTITFTDNDDRVILYQLSANK